MAKTITRICPICGNEFKIDSSHRKQRNCSFECGQRSRVGVLLSKPKKAPMLVEKTCQVCGNLFRVRASSRKNKTCSSRCLRQLRSDSSTVAYDENLLAYAITLTRGHVALVDEIDADLGQVKWHATAYEDGAATTYAKRSVGLVDGNKKFELMHRVILERMLNRPLRPHEQADHRNNNGLDNRRMNLRLANQSENNANRRRKRESRSGFKGVKKAGGKWRAVMRINGKHISLGTYDTPEEAHAAYCEEARRRFGEFANDGEW